MTVSVVNVVVAPGATQHITPVDQNGVAIPVGECVFSAGDQNDSNPLTAAVATVAADATGFVFTGVAPGSGEGRIKVTEGSTTTYSAAFSITVPSPVTAVGTTSP